VETAPVTKSSPADVSSQESALKSAMTVAASLAPDSVDLKRVTL
jgi:hypothetical protein